MTTLSYNGFGCFHHLVPEDIPTLLGTMKKLVKRIVQRQQEKFEQITHIYRR